MKSIKKIYKEILSEPIDISTSRFNALPHNLEDFHIYYIGKHKMIPPQKAKDNLIKTDSTHDLDKTENIVSDFASHLLIECRLYNKDEEYFYYCHKNEVMQRHITSGKHTDNGTARQYITKEIQLRQYESADGDQNREAMIARHYINELTGGYDFLRFIKTKRNEH